MEIARKRQKKTGIQTKKKIQIIVAAFLGFCKLITCLVWKTQEPSPFSCLLRLPSSFCAVFLSQDSLGKMQNLHPFMKAKIIFE